MLKKLLPLLCITSFFSIHSASYRFVTKTEQLIATSQEIHQSIFDFIIENEEKAFTPELEYTLKLLVRTIPEKTKHLSCSTTRYQTLPFISYNAILKKLARKITPLEKSFIRVLKKKHYGIHGKEKLENLFEQLMILKEDIEHTIAYIKKTDGYFSEYCSNYNQGESIATRSMRSCMNIIIFLLGANLVFDKYILYKTLTAD